MISYTLRRETVDGRLRWQIAKSQVAPSGHAEQYADERRQRADHTWPSESAASGSGS
jgi:hypothetical protein